ncbi:MAG: amidohydrolase family protein [Candidatus Gastranaerophilales bacterium]
MKCYKSKWIITSTGEVLEDMALLVDEGKIVDVVSQSDINLDEKYVRDFGNSVMTAGFVDLLTQFQYTKTVNAKPVGLKKNVKNFFKSFSMKLTFAGVEKENYSRKWASTLKNYFVFDESEKTSSFKTGLEASIKSGTTCFAQVSKDKRYFKILNKLPVKSYLFFEVFAESKDKSKKIFKQLRSSVEDLIFHKGENLHIGIMLHSISGVHKKLWQLFSKYGRKHNMLIMTRFAESSDELDWLEHGFSDIDLLHKFMGYRKISPYETGLSPVDYLEPINVLSNKIVTVNANYANENELKRLADTGVKFVYQPNYSEQFCNKKLSFDTVLKYFNGNFGFSTQNFDGDLNNFSLLKLAVEANSENILSVEELIKYLTIYPAKILRLDNKIGSLEAGKDADFNVYKLFDGESYADIVKQNLPYVVYSKGKRLVKNGDMLFTI